MSRFLVHCQHFLEAALSICTREIFDTQQKAHHVIYLGTWVHDKVLKADEKDWHVTEFSIFAHLGHPAVDMLVAVFDPPIEELGVLLFVVERRLGRVIVHSHQMEPGKIGV